MFKTMTFVAVAFVSGCAASSQLQKDFELSQARLQEMSSEVSKLQAEKKQASTDKDACERAMQALREVKAEIESEYDHMRPVVVEQTKKAYDWGKRAVMQSNK